MSGKAERLTLRDAETKAVEKETVNVVFDDSKRQYPVTTFSTEEELKVFLDKPAAVKVIHRVRLPRILTDKGVYWPPSERITSILVEKFQAYKMGDVDEPFIEDIGKEEGTDLSAAWEPIWGDYVKFRQYWRSSI